MASCSDESLAHGWAYFGCRCVDLCSKPIRWYYCSNCFCFYAAALADWAVFTKVKGSWIRRANSSNVVGSAVDSVVFPTIAFGALLPHIVAMQFVAKVAGGAVWAYVIKKIKNEDKFS